MSVLPDRILLSTDGSQDAVRAAGADLAKRSGAELHVVHVWHVRGSPTTSSRRS